MPSLDRAAYLGTILRVGRRLDPRHHLHLLAWVLIVVSFGSYRRRGPGELLTAAWLDWQIVMEILIWTALGVVAVWGVRHRLIDLRRLRFAPIAVLALFIAYASLSSLYAPSPGFSAFRGLQLGVAFLLVMMPNVDRSLMYKALFVFAAMNLIGSAVAWAPQVGLYEAWYRLRSMFAHASVVGIATAVGAAGLWARWLDRGLTPGELVALLVLVFACLASVSRTAIFGMALAMAVSLALRPRLRGWITVAWSMLGLAVIELFTGSVSAFLLRGQSRFELQTLTERTLVWEATIRRLPEAGLLGEGLGSTRFRPPVEIIGLGHAHNILLEALVTLGVIGGLLLTALLALWAWRLLAFRYLGHGSWTIRLVNVENVAIFIPLLGFCILDRGFLALGDALLPIYFAAIRIAQDDCLRLQTGSAVPQSARARRRRRRVAAEPSPSHTKGRSSMR